MADLRCNGRPTLNSRALGRSIKGDLSCAGSIILVCGVPFAVCAATGTRKPSPRRCRAARLVEEHFCRHDRYGASQPPTWGRWHRRLIKQASQVARWMWWRGHSSVCPSFGLPLLDW